jgi:hypothetical protein
MSGLRLSGFGLRQDDSAKLDIYFYLSVSQARGFWFSRSPMAEARARYILALFPAKSRESTLAVAKL